MSFRFRTVRELADDLKAELESLLDAEDAALFRQVAVFRQTRYPELAKRVDSQLLTPAAVIVPDTSTHDERDRRSRRSIDLRVFLVAGFPADRDGAGLDAHDLADAVIAHFLPPEATLSQPVSLNAVDWEPLAHDPVDTATHASVVRLTLRATDVRSERA